ncbi:MFS transporter [Variovorax paradoxus]|nr:MFS transporter [Variovorax paradoxus]
MVVVSARMRWASRAQFFGSGFIFATWGVHIPTVKTHYGVDEAALGLAMLAAGVGALLGLTRASRWIGHYGARGIAGFCGAIYALLLAALLAMPGYGALLGLLAVFGVVTGVFDVAINTEAAQLELRNGHPLMSGMHGMFSLGGMAGAVTGGAALAAGMPAQWHLTLVATTMAFSIALSARWMLPKEETTFAGAEDKGFRLPRGALAILGVLAALGLIAEGAIYDWSVLYLKQELGSPQQQAALGYASFSAAMAATRFGGDAMRARFSPAALLRGSASLAAVSMTLVLLADAPWLALVGFAGVGMGFANVVPVLFAASARVPGVEPARGIAAVSAAAYLGFMAGPPAIGFLAQLSSLTAALYVVVAFAAALAASARHANPA